MEVERTHVAVVPAQGAGPAGLRDEPRPQTTAPLDDLLGLTAQAPVLDVVAAKAERRAPVVTAGQLDVPAVGLRDESPRLGQPRLQAVDAQPVTHASRAPVDRRRDASDRQTGVDEALELVAVQPPASAMHLRPHRREPVLAHPVRHRRRVPPGATAHLVERQPVADPALQDSPFHDANTSSHAGWNVGGQVRLPNIPVKTLRNSTSSPRSISARSSTRPRFGRLRDSRAPVTTARASTTSSGNIGRGQPNSVPPGEPWDVDFDSTPSTNARIHRHEVNQPDAHRPPNIERRPASSSTWKGCG